MADGLGSFLQGLARGAGQLPQAVGERRRDEAEAPFRETQRQLAETQLTVAKEELTPESRAFRTQKRDLELQGLRADVARSESAIGLDASQMALQKAQAALLEVQRQDADIFSDPEVKGKRRQAKLAEFDTLIQQAAAAQREDAAKRKINYEDRKTELELALGENQIDIQDFSLKKAELEYVEYFEKLNEFRAGRSDREEALRLGNRKLDTDIQTAVASLAQLKKYDENREDEQAFEFQKLVTNAVLQSALTSSAAKQEHLYKLNGLRASLGESMVVTKLQAMMEADPNTPLTAVFGAMTEAKDAAQIGRSIDVLFGALGVASSSPEATTAMLNKLAPKLQQLDVVINNVDAMRNKGQFSQAEFLKSVLPIVESMAEESGAEIEKTNPKPGPAPLPGFEGKAKDELYEKLFKTKTPGPNLLISAVPKILEQVAKRTGKTGWVWSEDLETAIEAPSKEEVFAALRIDEKPPKGRAGSPFTEEGQEDRIRRSVAVRFLSSVEDPKVSTRAIDDLWALAAKRGKFSLSTPVTRENILEALASIAR